MSRLIDLIDAFRDANGGRSEASVARQIGVAPQTVNSWRNRGMKDLPDQETLRKLAVAIGVSEAEIFYAAGVDTGYIVETVTDDGTSETA